MARKDYIIKIVRAEGLLIKGGTSNKWTLPLPEHLRVDSAYSRQSAVADATARWIQRSALPCPPDELHQYTITVQVWPFGEGKDVSTYSARYLFSLEIQRKPTKIS